MAGLTPIPPISLALQEVPNNFNLTTFVNPPATLVVVSGDRGPKGDPGSGAVVNYVQAIPATTWTITHNLGYIPSVLVYDDAGDLCDANVIANTTTVLVTGAGPFSGSARLI